MHGIPLTRRYSRRLDLVALEPRQVLSTFGVASPSFGLLTDLPSLNLLRPLVKVGNTAANLVSDVLTLSPLRPDIELSAQIAPLATVGVDAPLGELLSSTTGLLTALPSLNLVEPLVQVGTTVSDVLTSLVTISPAASGGPDIGLSVQAGPIASVGVSLPLGSLLAPLLGLLGGPSALPVVAPGPISTPAAGVQPATLGLTGPSSFSPEPSSGSNTDTSLAMASNGEEAPPVGPLPTTDPRLALLGAVPPPSAAPPDTHALPPLDLEQLPFGPVGPPLRPPLTTAAAAAAEEPEAEPPGPALAASDAPATAVPEESSAEPTPWYLPALNPLGLLADFLPLGPGSYGEIVDSLDQLRRLAEQGEHNLYWLALSMAAVAVAGEVAYRQFQSSLPEVPLPPDGVPAGEGWSAV